MNNFSKLFFILLLVCCHTQLLSQRGNIIPDSISNNFFKEVEYKQKYWDSIGGVYTKKGEHKLFNRWKTFWEMRVDSLGNYPDPKLYLDAFNTANAIAKEKASKKDQFQTMPTWKELGPTENPKGQGWDTVAFGVGRVNIIRANPNNNQELYAGSAFGGAWKSTDAGVSWKPLYQTEFLSLGVSDIAISPSNPNIVYIATGDNDGAIAGGGTSYSIGILKTTDGGVTWNTTGSIYTIRENRIMARLWIHPENPNILLAGGYKGIIKTTDGGATWKDVLEAPRIADIEQMPNNVNTIYASRMAGGDVYRSDDMGETWERILQIQGARRVAIAVTSAAPNNIYAIAENSGGGFHSFVKSLNKGDTWNQTNLFSSKRQNYLGWNVTGNLNTTTGQGWYDLAIAVSPTNSNTIFIGGINIWKSTDGGTNFGPVSYWHSLQSYPWVHADIHDLTFVGNNLYATHDGGIDVTTNLGVSWTQRYKGMGVGQVYYFNNSKQNPNKIVIGCQDLGNRVKDGNTWSVVGGTGDGCGCRFDPTNDNRFYYSTQYGNINRSQNNSETHIFDTAKARALSGLQDISAFVTTFDVSPSGKLYVGYCNIYYSSNNGNTWTKQTNYSASNNSTIRNVKVSVKDEKYVYAHTRSTIYYTDNSGTNWKTRNPVGGQNISYILPHPENPQMFYITLSGYSDGNKLYKFDGQNWINLSGNLPNVPANCVAIQIENGKEKIYVGTDIGVYYGLEQTPAYIRWGNDLPNTCVTELELVNPNILRAATFGRGVWETTINNCPTESIVVNVDGETSICSKDSVRLYVATPNQTDIVWSTGATENEIWVKTAGNYYAVSNTNSDCLRPSNSINIVTKVQNNINVAIQGKTEMCIGDSVILNVPLGFKEGTFKWNTNDTGRTLVIKEAGIYFVSAENTSNDCISYSDTFVVNTYEKPMPTTIKLILDTTNNNTKNDTLEANEGVKFQWYKDGNIMNNQTGKRLIRQRNTTGFGIYTVIIAKEGDCYSEHSESFDYMAIKEDIEISMNISPIPAYNIINVEMPKEYYDEYIVTIIDITGKTIKELNLVNFNQGVEVFDVQALPTGTYMLKLESNKISIIKTFVKADK